MALTDTQMIQASQGVTGIFILILLNQELVKCLPFMTGLTYKIERIVRNSKLIDR
jgi:hypothetical protein